jgi:hypothetical protein
LKSPAATAQAKKSKASTAPPTLGEQPPPGGSEPTGRAVQDADRASALDAADVLAGSADGQVGEAVLVEVGP